MLKILHLVGYTMSPAIRVYLIRIVIAVQGHLRSDLDSILLKRWRHMDITSMHNWTRKPS